MPPADPIATFEHEASQLDETLAFVKRTRSELRELRLVRVWIDRVELFDVNGDRFEIRGLGYLEPEVVPLLDAVNAAYRRDSIHQAPEREFKEFKTGRRYPWAADRVM